MNRHSMREHVFKLTFSYEFDTEMPVEEHLEHYFADVKTKEDEVAYMSKRFKGILKNREAIEKVLNKASQKWEVSRIANVDLAILRVAVYEIFVDKEIPTNVAVNEAVEIAKKYGGDASPKFINGVLANIVNNKSGKAVDR